MGEGAEGVGAGSGADEFAVEVGISAAEGDQFVVGPAFDDRAGLEDEDAVGVADGGETMGDDEAGATFEEPFERVLDAGFGVRIDGGIL